MRICAGGEEKSRGAFFCESARILGVYRLRLGLFMCSLARFLGGLHSEAAIGMSWRVC